MLNLDSSATIFFSFWLWEINRDHRRKGLALMVTRYWKTLKTVENLADKPHLTLAKLSKTLELFFGGVNKLAKLLRIFKRTFHFKNFFWVQVCTSLPEKKGSP
jgi:hypothetical protein